jgi:hypothetical protein
MPVVDRTKQGKDTRDQIIEKLDHLSPDLLLGVLSYVEFVSMDPVSRSLLTCAVDRQPLRDDARELIEEAFHEPRPGVADEQIRKELGL